MDFLRQAILVVILMSGLACQGAHGGLTVQLMNCTRPDYIPDVAQFFSLAGDWVELNATDLESFPPLTELIYQCRLPGSEVIEGMDRVNCQSGKWTEEPPICLRMGREIVIGGPVDFPQRVEYDGSLTVFIPPPTSDIRLEVTCQMKRKYNPVLVFNVTLEEGRAGIFTERGDSILSKKNLTLSPPLKTDSGRFMCRDMESRNSHELNINFTVRDVKPIHECPDEVIYKSTEPGRNSTVVFWQSPQLPAGSSAGISSNFYPGDRFELGVTMVMFTATDEHGPLTVCSFVIQVNDTEPPNIEDCPQDIHLLPEPSEAYANASWVELKATDNTGYASLEMISGLENNSRFPIGQTTVTYLARDDADNEDVCTFAVIVTDMEPPIISCPPSQRLVLEPDQGTAVIDWPEPERADNSGDDVIVTSTGVTWGQRYPPGVYTVQYGAEDSAGNDAQCSFQIEIIDSQPPELINCPGDTRVFINPNERSNITISWDMPTASDNAGPVSVTSTHESGDEFHVGRHHVVIIAIDTSGNTAECTFVVKVIEGKCRAITSKNITWDESSPGYDKPSRQLCPLMTARAGQPSARRTCRLRSTIGAMWSSDAVRTECGPFRNNLTIQEIKEYPIDRYTAGDAATTLLETVMRNNETYAPQDVADITDIIEKITNANVPSREILESILATIEMVFLAEDQMGLESESALVSTRIIRALEQQVALLSTFDVALTIETKNIVVRTATANTTTAKANTAFHVSGFVGSKTGTGIPVVTIPVKEIGIVINEGKNQTTDLLHFGFIFYQNPILFWRAENASGSRDSDIRGEVVGGVVSASVANSNIEGLTDKVRIRFPLDPAKNLSRYSAKCVYWDFAAHNGNGGWSTEGCQLDEQTDEFIVCESNHLTHFAVIMDFTGTGAVTDPILDLLTKIGCALSIAGLSATIITFVAFRTLRNSRHRQILINHCASLLFLYVVFLAGIDSTKIFCVASAVLLHYFMLTTMFWMAVEANNMYMYLVKVFQRDVRRFILKASVFAWGVPILITAASVSVAQENYTHSDYCFPAPSINLYLSLLLPMALVMVHNFVIFSMVVYRLVCSEVAGKAITQSRRQQIVSRLQNAMCMSVLMGLSWSLGFFAALRPSFLFQLLFCVANSLQGLAVFILFCLRVSDVRNAYKTCMPWLDVELNIRGQSYKVRERPVHQYHSRNSKEADPMWESHIDRVSSALSWPSDTPGLEAYIDFQRQLSGNNTDSTRVTANSFSIHRSNSLFSRWT